MNDGYRIENCKWAASFYWQPICISQADEEKPHKASSLFDVYSNPRISIVKKRSE